MYYVTLSVVPRATRLAKMISLIIFSKFRIVFVMITTSLANREKKMIIENYTTSASVKHLKYILKVLVNSFGEIISLRNIGRSFVQTPMYTHQDV